MIRILIISKDVALKEKYTKEFVRSGFHTAEASDFMDGMLTAAKSDFDVLIIDEELYGVGLVPEFTKVRRYSKAFLVFLGINPVSEMPARGGFDAYFQRSADSQELVAYIKSIYQPVSNENIEADKKEVDPVSGQSDSIFNVVSQLEHQVARVKAVMTSLGQMREKISEAESITRQQRKVFDIVINRLSEVSQQLEQLDGKGR
jgi:DNA-binding response OmpR family regulator